MSRLSVFLLSCTLLTCVPGLARAAGPYAPGSSNTANIEPAVPHPAQTPCIVPLFASAQFGASSAPFTYAPPSGCPGPWARVVLQTKIGLNAGVQFDRTGSITLDGVSLWFGTTSEPRASLAPNWTVQTDVTRDTALLLKPGAGRVLIANYQSAVYTSTITASAELLFYPAIRSAPAPVEPDLIIPLASDAAGDSAGLGVPTDRLSAMLNLPRNVERATLDLTLQGQSSDEFWYTCVPNALTGPLQSCGGGAFREGEVAIDGRPAGEAPVYPLIFTGGIDPFLWEPIPGVTTLDIKPFPVELTPFASLLGNGTTHTLSVSVAGANNYFSVFGALYVWLDHGAGQVTGRLTADTLAGSPAPAVAVTSGTASRGATTHLVTSAADDYTVAGYVNTSHGRISTSVHQTLGFSNVQDFLVGGTVFDQSITQSTTTRTDIATEGPAGLQESVNEQDYPLTAAIDEQISTAGNISQKTTIDQRLHVIGTELVDGLPISFRDLLWTASPTDTLDLTSSFSITGNAGQSSTSSYASFDTSSGCSLVTLASVANKLTAATAGTSCLAALKALAD